jgi:hypothetical protein
MKWRVSIFTPCTPVFAFSVRKEYMSLVQGSCTAICMDSRTTYFPHTPGKSNKVLIDVAMVGTSNRFCWIEHSIHAYPLIMYPRLRLKP